MSTLSEAEKEIALKIIFFHYLGDDKAFWELFLFCFVFHTVHLCLTITSNFIFITKIWGKDCRLC